MSLSGGPTIVKNGLVLHLDASNIKSFKGEPTTNLITSSNSYEFNHSSGGTTLTWILNKTVQPGEKYILSAEFLRNSVHDGSIYFQFKLNNSSGVMIPGNSGLIPGYSALVAEPLYNYFQNSIKNLCVENWYKFSPPVITIPAGYENGNLEWVRLSSWGTSALLKTNIKNIQFEQKSYATPFVNGTRGSSVETGGGWANLVSTSNNAVVYGVSGVGNVISLDGVDDYIEIPNATSLVQGQSQFTMGLWCKLDVVNQSLRGLIGTGNYSCGYNLILTANNSSLTFYNDTTTCASVSWSTPLVANKWIFATARFDGTNSVVGGSIDGGTLSYNSSVLKTGSANTFTSAFRIMSPYHEYRTSGDVSDRKSVV